MWRTRMCDLLGIQYPILEGGLALEGNSELAAAVSEAGALGMIGSNPGWAPPDKQIENLRSHIRKAKGLTNKPFGVNIPLERLESQDVEEFLAARKKAIDLAIEEKVPVIVTVGGDPKLFTGYIKEAGVKVLHVVLNVRMAKRAEAAGVDAVIASGFEAGGLLSKDEIPTFVLVPLIVDAVMLPVVAAGGIGDARGFVAAMALGAEGVQLGTRFMATVECHAHQKFKEALVAAADCDTVVTRRNMPPLVRSLKTSWTKRLAEMDRNGVSPDEIRKVVGVGKMREGSLLGDLNEGDPLCGVIAALIKEITRAGDVVRSMIESTEEVLRRVSEWHEQVW